MPEKGPSNLIQIFIASFQIIIALIGLAGAIGAAIITTGYQFRNELDHAKVDVDTLKTQGQNITAKQSEVDQNITKLGKLLDDAAAKNAQLENALTTKNKELQDSLNTLREEVEKSKNEINTTKVNAIQAIENVKRRGLDQVVPPQ